MIISCVLRRGGVYEPDDVHRLIGAVSRNLSASIIQGHVDGFVCLTDTVSGATSIKIDALTRLTLAPLSNEWPGWWSKIELFNHPAINKSTLYFDLDTVITGDLGSLCALGSDRNMYLEDFYHPGVLASGLMYISREDPINMEIWHAMRTNPGGIIRRYTGDQNFIGTFVNEPIFLQDIFPGMITSFKPMVDGIIRDLAYYERCPTEPIVCFHGRPKPRDVISIPWVNQHWREV